MENLSHSRQPSRSVPTIPKKACNGAGFGPGKSTNTYDDVFGGPPRFGAPVLSPRLEDYGEIFGGFHVSRAYSIPLLDLPLVDQDEALFDVRSQGFDYTEVFGGFNGLDFAPSYEELLMEQSEGGDGDSSDDAWTPAETESVSGGTDPSVKSQCLSNGDSYESIDGSTEFSISYYKANPRSDADMSNGVTHVAELQTIPGYSFIVNEPASVPKDHENCSGHVTRHGRQEKDLKKVWSQPARPRTFDDDSGPRRRYSRNDSCPSETFLTVSDISLKTQPSDLPPPSRPPPLLDAKRRDSSSSASNCRTTPEGSVGGASPPLFDVEVDASSAAAAMKEAMEKAQVKLKNAKELMERKRDGIQSRAKPSSSRAKHGIRSDPVQGQYDGDDEWKDATQFFELVRLDKAETSVDDGNSKEVLLQGSEFYEHRQKVRAGGRKVEKSVKTSVNDDSERKEYSGKSEATIEVHRQKRYEKKIRAAKEVLQENVQEKFRTIAQNAGSDRKQATGDTSGLRENLVSAKQEDKFLFETNIDKNLEYRRGAKKSHGMQTSEKQEEDVFEWEENARKLREALGQANDETMFTRDLEEDEKKLEAALERIENEKRLDEARQQIENEMKGACEKEENGKKIKETSDNKKRLKEASEKAENRRRAREAEEKLENDWRVKEACEKEENERRVREVLEKAENEKRLKEAHEKEGNETREKDAFEKAEKEKLLKVAHEKEENERREKESFEKAEKEKLMKEAPEKEEKERRLKEAFEKAENDRKKEALEQEGKERSSREAYEQEEKEKRLREAFEHEEERRLQEAFEQAETERRLKEALEQEEKVKRQDEAYAQQENERIMEEAPECEESERKLEAALETEKTERQSKGAAEMKEQKKPKEDCEREKSTNNCDVTQEMRQPQNECEQEDNSKTLEEDQEAEDTLEREESGTTAGESCVWKEVENKLKDADKTDGVDRFNAYGNNVGKNGEGHLMNDQVYLTGNEEASRIDDSIQCQRNKTDVADSRETSQSVELENADIEAVNGHQSANESNVASKHDLENCEVKFANKSEEKKNMNHEQTAFNNEEKGAFMPARLGKDSVECRGGDATAKTDPPTNARPALRRDRNLYATPAPEEREKELERERLRKIEEDREREREREKDRMAGLNAEALERAERAAVERATNEARQRALAEARERLERACAEAREKSMAEKSAMEARLRAERAAVERATAEARERAAEKAALGAREKVDRSVSDKFSSSSRSSTGPQDKQFQTTASFGASRYPDPSAYSNGVDGESPQRYISRLERHRRTSERVAKALADKNMRDLIAQREQAERTRLAEALDADVKRWSSGKEGNIRALLSTLQYILGPESGWRPIHLTEVITSAAVKKAYRKATLCVHPDKLQQRGATVQQKYVCEKVFDLLKEAWNRFNSEER